MLRSIRTLLETCVCIIVGFVVFTAMTITKVVCYLSLTVAGLLALTFAIAALR